MVENYFVVHLMHYYAIDLLDVLALALADLIPLFVFAILQLKFVVLCRMQTFDLMDYCMMELLLAECLQLLIVI